jgi:four helix bundle protein
LDWVSVQALQDRTKRLALRVIRMVDHLPRTDAARTIGRQTLRSATAVAANYRAACRSRSKAEFSAKIGVVVEEADETVFWLEILGESGIVDTKRLGNLVREASEIRSIMAASHRTARAQAVARRTHRSINNSTNQQFNK